MGKITKLDYHTIIYELKKFYYISKPKKKNLPPSRDFYFSFAPKYALWVKQFCNSARFNLDKVSVSCKLDKRTVNN